MQEKLKVGSTCGYLYSPAHVRESLGCNIVADYGGQNTKVVIAGRKTNGSFVRLSDFDGPCGPNWLRAQNVRFYAAYE